MNFFKPLGFTIISTLVLTACARPSIEERMENIDELISQGDTREAIVMLKSIVSEEVDNANLRLRLAEAYFAQGNLASSEKEARKAIELDVATPKAKRLLIESLFFQDKFEDLLLTAERDAKDPRVNFLEALSLLQLNEFAKAAELYDSRDFGSDSSVFQAHMLARQGRLSNALELLRKRPLNPTSIRLAGQIYFLQGDYSDAAEHFEVFAARFPNNVRVQAYYVSSLLAAEQVEKASELLANLPKPLKESPLFLTFRSQVALYNTDYDLALELSQKARAAGLESNILRVVTAVSSFEKKNYEMAFKMLSALEGMAKENPNIKSLLILSKSHLGYSVDSDINGYVSDEYATQEDKLTLALQLTQMGNLSGAKEIKSVLDSTLDLESEEVAVKSALLNSSVSGSSNSLERLIELASTNVKDPALILVIAAKLYDKEQYGRVIKILESKTNPSNLDESQKIALYTLLSGAYISLNEMNKAQDSLSKLKALSPASPLIFQMNFRELISEGKESEAIKLAESYLSKYGFNQAVANNLLTLPSLEKAAIQQQLAKLYAGMKGGPLQQILFLAYSLGGNNAEIKAVAIRDGIFDSKVNRLLVAKAVWELDGPNEALSYFESSLPESTLSAKEFIFKANLLEATGAPEMALSTILRAQSIHPSDRELQFQQFYFLVELSRYDAAQHLLETLKLSKEESHILQPSIDKLPQNNSLSSSGAKKVYVEEMTKNHLHDWMLLELRNNGRAHMLQILTEYQSNNSNDTVAMEYLADALILQEPEKSKQLYERLISEGRSDVNILNNLSWLYLKTGDLSRALELGEEAITLAPNSTAVQSTLGAIYFELSNYDEASSLLERSVNNSTAYSKDTYLMLVESLVKVGEKDKAKQYLDKLSDEAKGASNDLDRLSELVN